MKKTVRALVGDIRQGLVGGAAFVVLSVIGGLLVAWLASDVPAWTLAFAIVAAPLVLYVKSGRDKHEIGRLAGLLEAETARRKEVETKFGTVEAKLGKAEASLSGRPKFPPLEEKRLPSGLQFRIQSLRGEIQNENRQFVSKVQGQALYSIATDIAEEFQSSRSLESIQETWNLGDRENNLPKAKDAITTLGQLEGLLISLSDAASGPWSSVLEG